MSEGQVTTLLVASASSRSALRLSFIRSCSSSNFVISAIKRDSDFVGVSEDGLRALNRNFVIKLLVDCWVAT